MIFLAATYFAYDFYWVGEMSQCEFAKTCDDKYPLMSIGASATVSSMRRYGEQVPSLYASHSIHHIPGRLIKYDNDFSYQV